MKNTKGFVKAPHSLLEDERLTPGDKMVYLGLSSFAWNDERQCFPSVKSLAARCGISETHISKHTKRLQELEYIQVVARGHGGGNLYKILALPACDPSAINERPRSDKCDRVVAITADQISSNCEREDRKILAKPNETLRLPTGADHGIILNNKTHLTNTEEEYASCGDSVASRSSNCTLKKKSRLRDTMISGTKKRFASTFNTPPIGNNFSRPNPFDTEYNDGFKHGNWWREETNEDIPQTVDDFLSWFGNVYQTIIKQPYVPSPYDRKLTKKLFYDIKITRKRSNTDGDDGYFFKIMMDHAWKVLTSDEFGVGKPMKRTIQTVYSRFDDEYRNRASTLIASHKRIRAFIKNKEHDPGLKA